MKEKQQKGMEGDRIGSRIGGFGKIQALSSFTMRAKVANVRLQTHCGMRETSCNFGGGGRCGREGRKLGVEWHWATEKALGGPGSERDREDSTRIRITMSLVCG